MTAPTEVNIGTLIERRPGVYGGRPVLKGTRFPVMQLAVMHQQGADLNEILRRLPHLDPVLVHAGLVYYLANRELVDAELAEEEELYRAEASR
jgi:uncharacterized protein (DUF433 family)